MAKKARANAQRYTVDLTMDARDIAKAGSAMKITIREHEAILGTVEIGQGTFGWRGPRKKSFDRIPWGQLAAFFDDK